MLNRCKNRDGGIFEPGCGDGKWERTLIILYGKPLGSEGKDVYHLCIECAQKISERAKAQGHWTNFCG